MNDSEAKIKSLEEQVASLDRQLEGYKHSNGELSLQLRVAEADVHNTRIFLAEQTRREDRLMNIIEALSNVRILRK